MSDTLQLVIKDIDDCLYEIQSERYSATLDLEKAFENVLQLPNPLFPRLE